ncbi:MAG: periplasmic heavy metal sensor [bacterium]
MRTRWLVAALLVSLALNAGAIGAFAYFRYRRWSGHRRFYRELRTGARERVSAVLREHEGEMDSLRYEYFETRRALALLGDSAKPDSTAVDSLLDRLAGVHREMNRVAFSTGREIFGLFPDKRRGALRERWERMHDGRGRRGRRQYHFRRDCGPYDPRPDFEPIPGEPPPPPRERGPETGR